MNFWQVHKLGVFSGLDAVAASECGGDICDMGSETNLAKQQSHGGLCLVWSGMQGRKTTSVVWYQSNCCHKVAQG